MFYVDISKNINIALACHVRFGTVHASLNFFLRCKFPERMDVKARGRCDDTAETGLRAAESQELHPVVGVRTDMNLAHKKPSENTGANGNFTVLSSVVVLRAFCKILVVYNKFYVVKVLRSLFFFKHIDHVKVCYSNFVLR